MRRINRLQIILLIATVGLLALSVLFIIGYFQATGKTPDLEKEIKQTQNQISMLEGSCNLSDAIQRLEELQRRLINESSFSEGPLDNKEVMNDIVSVVNDANVNLNSLNYQGSSSMGLGNGSYTANNFDLECSTDEGREDRFIVLLELFEELREEDYNTLLIENVALPGGASEITFGIIIITQ